MISIQKLILYWPLSTGVTVVPLPEISVLMILEFLNDVPFTFIVVIVLLNDAIQCRLLINDFASHVLDNEWIPFIELLFYLVLLLLDESIHIIVLLRLHLPMLWLTFAFIAADEVSKVVMPDILNLTQQEWIVMEHLYTAVQISEMLEASRRNARLSYPRACLIRVHAKMLDWTHIGGRGALLLALRWVSFHVDERKLDDLHGVLCVEWNFNHKSIKRNYWWTQRARSNYSPLALQEVASFY